MTQMHSKGYPISCCLLVSQQQNILLWALSPLRLVALMVQRSWGGVRVRVWRGDDIIYMCQEGKSCLGLGLVHRWGEDLVVLAYISALSCIVLAIPVDNRSLLCLGLPPSICLCVHLFAPVPLSSRQFHQAYCSSMDYRIYCTVWCRNLKKIFLLTEYVQYNKAPVQWCSSRLPLQLLWGTWKDRSNQWKKKKP